MNVIKTLLILVCIFFFDHSLYSQEIQSNPGHIIDSIKVKHEPSQTYQLYLPSYFNKDKNWPVVFIFDPGARGSVGIKPFIKSAETYGYILICSNNSRNDLFSINYKIADNLFFDATTRLSTDTSRIYLAGFSGGSRLSSSIASNNKSIKGVVACGAGLPPSDFFNTKANLSFSFAGIIGDRDMNYLEMIKNQEYLNQIKLSNTLFVYEGNHSWPPDSIILRAFDWLEIEYLKQNNLSNPELIKRLYIKDYTFAIKCEISNKLIEAYNEYTRILNNYSNSIEIDSISKKISELEQNKSYRKQNKKKLQVESNEENLLKSYFKRLVVDSYSRSDTVFEFWKIEGEKTQRLIKSKNTELNKMAERIQSNIWIWCYESGQNFEKSNDTDRFVFTNNIWILFKPSDVYPHFHLAKYYASIGDSKKAIKHLEQCLKNGLNKKRIQLTEEFKSLESNKKFKEIINSTMN